MPMTRLVFTTLLFGAFGASALAAQSRKAGDTLVYESVQHTQNSGGSLPAVAYKPIALTTTVTIAVTSVDSDGSSRVHVKEQKEMPAGFNALGRTAWESTNKGHEFDAKLSADGALLASVDLAVLNADVTGKSLADTRDKIVAQAADPAYQSNVATNEVKGFFSTANAIALGAGKRTAFNSGDAWRIVVKSDGATWDLAVTGKQSYHGRDVVVITAKMSNDYPSGSNSVDATGYYDPQARLVVGVHSAILSEIHATSMKSTTTSDLNLKE